MTKWLGPAAWARKEARAGDRLPYACHVDAATLRLRDGSLMRSMRLAGFPFETEDDDVLNHLLAVRDVVLRSALNSKAVLYHHVIRRLVEVDLGARNPDPVSTEIDRRWTAQLNQGRRSAALCEPRRRCDASASRRLADALDAPRRFPL